MIDVIVARAGYAFMCRARSCLLGDGAGAQRDCSLACAEASDASSLGLSGMLDGVGRPAPAAKLSSTAMRRSRRPARAFPATIVVETGRVASALGGLRGYRACAPAWRSVSSRPSPCRCAAAR